LPAARDGEIEIRYCVKLEAQKEINSWAQAAALEPLHIVDESVVRERFEYKSSGLHVALVRVFRLDPLWVFPDQAVYGGCRSWVNLPEHPANTRLEPVLSDREHEERSKKFRSALGIAASN
jgi:hypothetical protein